ncbi:hypothetical protein [Odoribacter laneus]|uniref:hypothetical protein n=1 Tax=Odoribacter laneus TaxID=626933 RepID=UPI003AB3F866
MINYAELTTYSYQMINDSLSFSKLLNFFCNCAVNQNGSISEEEIRKAFEFMKARDKQNIEKEVRLSDEQKEKEKQQMDAWYDNCEQMLKAELGKRCEIRNC